MSSTTLLILAAGMGSRYGGLKQLDPVGQDGETLLDYSVFDARRAGFDRIVFVIRRDFEKVFREQVGRRYESRGDVDYAFQQLDMLPPGFSVPAGREKPWGTTHAIWCARDAVRGPFAAINADDFYGRDAFSQLAVWLNANSGNAQPASFSMVGYRLDNTLSDHGSVSRGVCRVGEDGNLLNIVEQTKIESGTEGIRQTELDGSVTRFSGNEIVSMNFWGLNPAIFPMLEDELQSFLRDHSGNPKSESYIPTTIGRLIERRLAAVHVLKTTSAWFGVTYREDKPRVQASILELCRNGVYPGKLRE
jgi:NDP-sugar pyrophosphorylase family protein